MTGAIDRARSTLVHGADLIDLAEAIGTIIRDPSSTLDDLRLALRHGGVIAEQAALELRRRQAASNSAAGSQGVVLAGDGKRDKPQAEAR